MDDMDIDMDIDLHIDPETEQAHDDPFIEPVNTFSCSDTQRRKGSTDHVKQTNQAFDTDNHDLGTAWPAVQPLETVDGEIVSSKVHIRGLDSLSTDEVKNIALQHYPESFTKVEWIDDTSANLIYSTSEAGTQALLALTTPDQPAQQLSPLQTRPAKKLSSHPLTEFYIRQATTADVKKKKAYEASRYYLLHPDQDPRERAKQEGGNRRGPRQRRAGSDDESGDYSRRRFDDRELKRRRDAQDFDASMYDEGTGTEMDDDDLFSDSRKMRTRTGPGRRRDGEDLFGEKLGTKTATRLRNRSASPGRRDRDREYEGDGTMGFDEDPAASSRRANRARSRTPPRRAPRTANGNIGKELFTMNNDRDRSMTSPTHQNQPKELFPVKSTSNTTLTPSKDLFPSHRNSISRHRRSGAVDASPRSSTFDLLSGSPTSNGLNGFPEPANAQRSLADRITGGRGGSSSINVRGAGNADLSVRGQASGLSVKGAAVPTARELFPMKAGGAGGGGAANLGKELFAEKIEGRGRNRRKAEEMFY